MYTLTPLGRKPDKHDKSGLFNHPEHSEATTSLPNLIGGTLEQHDRTGHMAILNHIEVRPNFTS